MKRLCSCGQPLRHIDARTARIVAWLWHLGYGHAT